MNMKCTACGLYHSTSWTCTAVRASLEKDFEEYETGQPTLSQDVLEAVPAWGVALKGRLDSHLKTLAKQAGNAMDLEARVATLEPLLQTYLNMTAKLDARVAKLEKAIDWVAEYAVAEPEDTLEPIPWGGLD